MATAVRCPNKNCRHLVRVSQSLRGQRIQCPACGQGLRIPGPKKEAPEPVALDDTPPDMPAIRTADDQPAPKTSKKASKTNSGPSTTDLLADQAAGVSSALSPFVKLAIAVVVLAGLILLSTQVLFPMLWANKAASTATEGELTREEQELLAQEEARKHAERPLGQDTKDRIEAMIAAEEFVTARDLLDGLKDDKTVPADDRRALEAAYTAALRKHFDRSYADVDRQLGASEWEAARRLLSDVEGLDPGEARSQRYIDVHHRIDAAEASALLQQSKEAVEKNDFDAAQDFLDRALKLDQSSSELRGWKNELAVKKASGLFVDTGNTPAAVYVDGARMGQSGRTIWGLPERKKFMVQVRAAGYVPYEFRESLSRGRPKEKPIQLVAAVPDGLWVASLLETSAERWLAFKVLPTADTRLGAYESKLAEKCRAKQDDAARKRIVWTVRMADGKSHVALEYTALGSTVRFVDMANGKRVATTKDKIAGAEAMSEEKSVREWLQFVAERTAKADNPCEVFRRAARFVEVYPDKIDELAAAEFARLSEAAAKLVTVSSCQGGAKAGGRDEMATAQRIDAEINAWKLSGLNPPADLVALKNMRP